MRKTVTILATILTVAGIVGCSSDDHVVRQTTERSYSSSATANPLPPPVQERSTYRAEQRSSTMTSDPLDPVQERSSSSFKTEERSSTMAPVAPPVQERSSSRTRIEQREVIE